MKVLVTGSRDYSDAAAVHAELARLPAGTTVIHGAARGADSLADAAARQLGFEVIACPADWKRQGRAAGVIRNKTMLDEHKPELVIAFPIGDSKGTRDMIRRARERNIEVIVIEIASE